VPTPGLDESARTAFESLGQRRRYAAGRTLFREGEASDRVFLIHSGRVKVVTVSAEGRELLLAVRGPGELIGEMSVLDGQPRSASAITLEPVEAFTVDAAGFTAFLEAAPATALSLLRVLTERLRDSDRALLQFSARDVSSRVAARLAALAMEHGEEVAGGTRITVPLTQAELASYTGASREAVSRALQQLREDGVVSTARRGIVVLDLDRLRAQM
jgi:CRP-like cAMP-binding protein